MGEQLQSDMELHDDGIRHPARLFHTNVKKFCVAFAGIGFSILGALCFSAEDLILFEANERFQPAFIFVCNSVVALCLCSILILIVRPERPRWRTTTYTQIILTVAYGSFNCVMQISVSLAIFVIGPGNAITVLFTMPVFSAVLSVVFLGHNFKIGEVILALCSTTGVALICLSLEEEEGVSPSEFVRHVPAFFGVALAIIAAVSFSAALVIGNKLSLYECASPLINVLSYAAQYSAVSLALCTALGDWALPTSIASALLLLGTGFTTFGGIFFCYLAVMWKRPATVSIILTSEVPMTFVGQLVFFGFEFSWFVISGFVLIMVSAVGILLCEERDERRDGERDREEGDDCFEQGDRERRPILK